MHLSHAVFEILAIIESFKIIAIMMFLKTMEMSRSFVKLLFVQCFQQLSILNNRLHDTYLIIIGGLQLRNHACTQSTPKLLKHVAFPFGHDNVLNSSM